MTIDGAVEPIEVIGGYSEHEDAVVMPCAYAEDDGEDHRAEFTFTLDDSRNTITVNVYECGATRPRFAFAIRIQEFDSVVRGMLVMMLKAGVRKP